MSIAKIIKINYKLYPFLIASFFIIVFQTSAIAEDMGGVRYSYLNVESAFPVDSGGGLVMPRAVSYYYDDNFWGSKTTFEGIFAGPYMSVSNSHWLPPDTGFNAGGRLFTLIHFGGDPIKYDQGKLLLSETFNGSMYGGELFISKDFNDNTNAKLSYALMKNNYYSNTDTNPTFVLPADNTTQAVSLRIETKDLIADPWGKPKSGYHLWADGGFYFADQYKAWGMPPNLSVGKKDYSKYGFFGGFYSQPFGTNKGIMAITGSGRYGSGLDRTTMFSLGGVSTIIPDSLMLHGYYNYEFYVDNVTILNWEYSLPLFPVSGNNSVIGYIDYDWAFLPSGNLRGVGVGVKWPLSDMSVFSFDYGYGMDAIRNGVNGGSSITIRYEQVSF